MDTAYLWDTISTMGVEPIGNCLGLNDPVFRACYPYFKKIVHKRPEDDEDDYGPIIRCDLIWCRREFDEFEELQMHYLSEHSFRCSVCNSVWPTHHILERHVLEIHDSHFAVLAEKNPMFECLYPSCKSIFKDPFDRRDHCLRYHNLPEDFRYDLLDDDIMEDESNLRDAAAYCNLKEIMASVPGFLPF